MDNLNFKNGYYKVGNEFFTSKVLAVYRSSQVKLNVEWYFHDREMSLYDWTKEPSETLNELYKIRANQIREKYDYIIIFCSGGADSTNTLYSFLKNNIHVDEVIAGAPLSGLKNWEWNSADHSAENTISETKFSQIPLMEEIKKYYPKTKVTLHDYFIDMVNYKTDDWLIKSSDYIHPTFAARYNLERYEYSYIRKLAEQGKKVGLVYGIDKPFLSYKDGYFYTHFRDSLVCNGFQSIDHPNVEVELFYYSPDSVPLLIKQAHIAAKWITEPINKVYRDNAVQCSESAKKLELTRKFTGMYERALVPTIYPMLENTTFQCHKPKSTFMGEHDAWFPYLHNETKARQLMVSDYKNFVKSIDNSYFRKDISGNILGFRLHYKYYRIGKETDFIKGNL
jgi:hypothetical protein